MTLYIIFICKRRSGGQDPNSKNRDIASWPLRKLDKVQQLTYTSLTGAWLIHPILIFCLKILFDIVPGITQEVSWTLTNLTYMAGSYIMFHWVRGIPFDFNSGAYDNLNMWEQIDNEQQFTPTKKYLLSVPIVLFLVSTHYTHYEVGTFTLNLVATILVTIPKLPAVSLCMPSQRRLQVHN